MLKSFLSASVMFVSAATYGQDAVRLDSITVRGTKDERGFSENPESVIILQENEISGAGRDNDIQVLNAVPNVEVNKGGESFSIRGVNNTGVTGYQKDNLASIVSDDLFQTDLALQAGSFDLWDMERIEVLRGAQSTTQGVNSLAGSILLDHRRPTLTNEGAFKLGLGNYGRREMGFVTNNTLVEGKVAARVSFGTERDDGFVRNVATDNEKWGQRDRDRFRLALLYKMSERDSLELDGKFHGSEQGGAYVQGTDPFVYEVNENVDALNSTKNQQASLAYTRRLDGGLTNRTVVGISASRQKVRSDADGTALDTAGVRLDKHEDEFVSVENRLNYTGERVTNVFGVHAHRFVARDDYDFNLLYPVGGGVSTPISVVQDVTRERESVAIFDTGSYRLTENHEFIAGLRGEAVRVRYGTTVLGERLNDLGTAANTSLDQYLTRVSGSYEGDKEDTVVLPKLGYAYHLDHHHGGLLYTRGYRTAGVSINRSRSEAVPYDAEFTNNYELWYKFVADKRQVSTNVFYTDWRAQQVQVQLSNDFYDTEVQNAARSEVYGAELEGKTRVAQNQSVSAGVGYTDTAFKKFEVNGVDYTGKEFPFASHWTGRVAHELAIPADWVFLTVARYVSGAYTNAENTRRADEQVYLDWNAKYALNTWIAEGYVNNVLDKRYRTFDGSPTSATSPYQASYHQVSAPRELGVRVSYFW